MDAARPVGRPVRHPVFARLYASQSAKAEGRGVADQRRRTLAGLEGRVLEVGAGNGLSFGHYPRTVDEVVAVEPEPYLRERAVRAAAAAPVPVRVVDGLAEALPAADGEFDAVVAIHVLCSVADPVRAAGEMLRVLRPGGELRFNEHVVSERPALARLQRAADATIWPRVAGGCHLARDTAAVLEGAGFAVERSERYTFGLPPLDPPKPHILGTARRPAG